MKRQKYIVKADNISLGHWVVLALTIIIFNIPLIATLATSLKTPAQVSASPPVWIFKPTLDNFREVLTSPSLKFPRYLLNSLLISTTGTLLAIVVTAPAAYAIVRYGIGRKILLPFVANLRTIPLIIFGLPFYFMYQYLHLLDTVAGLGIIGALINLPLSLAMFVGFFQDMPIELEEAAYIDGANVLQVFIRIIIPLAVTTIASVAILNFIYCWNEFLFGLILTTRKATPVTVGATFFITSFGVKWGQTAAAIMLSVLPPVVIGVVTFRFLTRSLLSGALKG